MPKILHSLLIGLFLLVNTQSGIPDSKRAADIRGKVWPGLQKNLHAMGLGDDQPIYLRIIKETNTLQVWVFSGKEFKLFKSYDICFFSGGLGTKMRDGDSKSPEGYYTIKPSQLNPMSTYHLSINVGYPNVLEKQLKYTGDAIMIHGDCVSIGCFAMTDPVIEEVYTLVYEAFLHGQKSIELNILPFKMDDAHMKTYASSPNIAFWRNLKTGYDIFQRTHMPPIVSVNNKSYVFTEVNNLLADQ
jgi:murein L,D-transpeptidase YafK